MDALMDSLWDNILAMILYVASVLDWLLTPFHILGPMFILSLLAFITVLVTKLLNKVIITKRYIELEKEFQHWFKIREEAMQGDDYDKAKRLARNIDQAKLNRVYYDYFLEGFLLGLARNVLPIFIMVTYVNESFKAENLTRLFGKAYVLALPTTNGKQLFCGSIFYYILSLLLMYLAWAVIKRLTKKKVSVSKQQMDSIPSDIV